MNKQVTDKETLLDYADGLLKKEGEDGLSMRSLAKKAGISLGAVYNYFPNKDAIVGSLMENFWKNVFFNCLCKENTESLSSLQILKKSDEILHENYDSFSSLFTLSKHLPMPEKMFGSGYIRHFVLELSKTMEKEDADKTVFSSSFKSEDYALFLFVSLLQGLLRGPKGNDFLLSLHSKIMKGSSI